MRDGKWKGEKADKLGETRVKDGKKKQRPREEFGFG